MNTNVSLYVRPCLDGLLVMPRKQDLREPDSRRRVFLAGDPNVAELNDLQVAALVDLTHRDPTAHERFKRVVFYDADQWAVVEKHKRVHVRMLVKAAPDA
jgi:hypothetical protein